VELGQGVFGFASVNDIEYGDNSGISSNLFNAGLGSHWSLSPTLDLVSGVSWERIEVKASGVSVSDDGIGLNVGLRGVFDRLELTGTVKYSDFGHTTPTTSRWAPAVATTSPMPSPPARTSATTTMARTGASASATTSASAES
jgi:hypothetical protein